MRPDLSRHGFSHKTITLAAALVATSLAAATAVVGATNALATQEAAGMALRPASTAPVEARAAEPAPIAAAVPTCGRAVRVVYGGYGTPAPLGCAAAR